MSIKTPPQQTASRSEQFGDAIERILFLLLVMSPFGLALALVSETARDYGGIVIFLTLMFALLITVVGIARN